MVLSLEVAVNGMRMCVGAKHFFVIFLLQKQQSIHNIAFKEGWVDILK